MVYPLRAVQKIELINARIKLIVACPGGALGGGQSIRLGRSPRQRLRVGAQLLVVVHATLGA